MFLRAGHGFEVFFSSVVALKICIDTRRVPVFLVLPGSYCWAAG